MWKVSLTFMAILFVTFMVSSTAASAIVIETDMFGGKATLEEQKGKAISHAVTQGRWIMSQGITTMSCRHSLL